MKLALAALVLALGLAGCQVEPVTAPGTVLSVQEAKQVLPDEMVKFDDGDLRLPEVAWRVEVRLDDGSHVTATYTGARRYAPGERVRMLIDAERALLL